MSKKIPCANSTRLTLFSTPPHPTSLSFFSSPLHFAFWSKILSAVGHSSSAGDRDEYQEWNKIHRRVPFTFSETQTVFTPFPWALSLHFQLPQVALGEQRKWGRGVRKLSHLPGGEQGSRHWQRSSASTAMVSSGPATCFCILSPCHGHPHTRGRWRGVWSTDQGKLMRCQTSRDRQRFPPLLQE